MSRLHSEDGEILQEHEAMSEELTRYFTDLLSEPILSRQEAITHVTENIPSLINIDHNASLMQPISM